MSRVGGLVSGPAKAHNRAWLRRHQGFYSPDFLPLSRGFNYTNGFLCGGEDHFEQWGILGVTCPGQTPDTPRDIWVGDAPEPDLAGQYTGTRFAEVRQSRAWDACWALCSTHMSLHPRLLWRLCATTLRGTATRLSSCTTRCTTHTDRCVSRVVTSAPAAPTPPSPLPPLPSSSSLLLPQFQALPDFLDEYPNISFATQQAYYAMVSTVDSSVRNVTEALKAAGLWNNTLLVWATDNGASGGRDRQERRRVGLSLSCPQALLLPKGAQTTLFAAARRVRCCAARAAHADDQTRLPCALAANWEGGIRTPAFVNGGLLPDHRRGKGE